MSPLEKEELTPLAQLTVFWKETKPQGQRALRVKLCRHFSPHPQPLSLLTFCPESLVQHMRRESGLFYCKTRVGGGERQGFGQQDGRAGPGGTSVSFSYDFQSVVNGGSPGTLTLNSVFLNRRQRRSVCPSHCGMLESLPCPSLVIEDTGSFTARSPADRRPGLQDSWLSSPDTATCSTH